MPCPIEAGVERNEGKMVGFWTEVNVWFMHSPAVLCGVGLSDNK